MDTFKRSTSETENGVKRTRNRDRKQKFYIINSNITNDLLPAGLQQFKQLPSSVLFGHVLKKGWPPQVHLHFPVPGKKSELTVMLVPPRHKFSKHEQNPHSSNLK